MTDGDFFHGADMWVTIRYSTDYNKRQTRQTIRFHAQDFFTGQYYTVGSIS